MISNLKELQRYKKDSRFNIQLGMKGIQAKERLEDAGIFNKGSFADLNYGKNLKPKDRNLLQNKLKTLEKEGYGLLPADHLKLAVL